MPKLAFPSHLVGKGSVEALQRNLNGVSAFLRLSWERIICAVPCCREQMGVNLYIQKYITHPEHSRASSGSSCCFRRFSPGGARSVQALHLPLCMGGCAGCACSSLPAQGLRAASAKANRCSSRRARPGSSGCSSSLQFLLQPLWELRGSFPGVESDGGISMALGVRCDQSPSLLLASPLTQP